MLKPAPVQLFDNSEQELWTQTPELKSNEDSPPSNAINYDANDDEWQNFDDDAYQKRALKRLPWLEKSEFNWRDLNRQLWAARQFSPATTRWMMSDLPAKSLWEFLGADELKSLKYEALRGFQQTPGSLRREPVQKRLAAWLHQHPDELHLLLLRWALREPQPDALQAVAAQSDEAALQSRLPSLLRSFGPHALSAALAFNGQTRLFSELSALIGDPQKLKELIENASPYSTDETPTEPIAPPQADAEAAHFWREQAMSAQDMLEEIAVKSRELAATQAQAERAQARVKTLENEIANGKQREINKEKQFAKKLEQIEKKWAAKYEELGKIEAREERRVRALQSQIEELELDNKRGKKQLRQSAQSREEERRKVIALEAKLAQLRGDNATTATGNSKPMDAVSSPPTTQDAPNRVVKVSKPSPLDEIFEWQAHGRRIRLTAREVRRLIDRNDEARVGTVLMELDALAESNPELRDKFLERLKQAGTYYPRVLTHRTSRVLVDASNVARYLKNRYGKGQLIHLQMMRQELQRLDCWPIIFVADASLPYNIDQPNELREMARQGEIVLTDKGVEADEILAREARATGAYVVTNDAKFFYKVSPNYEPPRITFRVLDGLVVVDEF